MQVAKVQLVEEGGYFEKLKHDYIDIWRFSDLKNPDDLCCIKYPSCIQLE